jgi:ubiquitin carboxyl-terminal hydrolase 9/24
MYSLLMPAQDPMSDRAFEFQASVIQSEKAQIILDMLKDPNFMPSADLATKRQAYLQILRLSKLILTIVGHVMAHVLDDNRISVQSLPSPTSSDAPQIGNHTAVATGTTLRSKMVAVLRNALQSVPNQSAEYTMRQVANKLAQAIALQVRFNFVSTNFSSKS